MLKINSDIPISFLETLVSFSKLGTTKSTAHYLKVTQPTISRRLKALDELLPTPILIRNGRNLLLTEYAKSLIEGLDQPLLKIKETLNNVNQNAQNENKVFLKIAARSEILDRFFLRLEFSGKTDLIPASSEAIHKMIALHQVDLAVIHNLKIASDYLSQKLFSSKPLLVIPKAWITSKMDIKQWKQICSNYPLAVYKGDDTYLKKFLKLHSPNPKPRIGLISASWRFIEARCAEGKNWAIIPSEYASIHKSYLAIDLPSYFKEMNFYLVYKSELKRYSWFKLLLQSILKSNNAI